MRGSAPVTPLPSVPRVRRAVLSAVLCAGLALSATACTEEKKPDPDKGTNGVGKLTPREIETKARVAADAAKAVRVSGTLVSKGGTFRLNMQLKEGGGAGSVTSRENTFELLRVDDQLYVKADASFWVHEDGDKPRDRSGRPGTAADQAAAGKLGGKYVKVPQGDPAYQEFRGFTEYLTREIAGLRRGLGEVATRDWIRSELQDLAREMAE
ncbi:hypothetical protein, partial [Streptomyces clavuligerus]|uniref:hypothetical protein n=1 Tax=Streptomyces clavuligerus TaxID=1901 RepID=UPI001E3454E2